MASLGNFASLEIFMPGAVLSSSIVFKSVNLYVQKVNSGEGCLFRLATVVRFMVDIAVCALAQQLMRTWSSKYLRNPFRIPYDYKGVGNCSLFP